MTTPVPAADWPPLLEHQLTPYQATSLDALRSLLVLAPHPDDEVFGCGGLLALATELGKQLKVVVLTDGGKAGDLAVREAESRAAAHALGGASLCDALEFWRLPDRGLKPDEALQQRIGACIDASGAEWVLAPSPFEVHPDHRAVCFATVEAISDRVRAGRDLQLAFCEIGVPLLANALIDITPVAERKARAMRCFPSQLAWQAYDTQIEALNRYRAYTLGPNVTHAEALWLVSADELAGGAEGLVASVGEQLLARR
jgi:LmbE family N-acetylglucosaminyl deacetylase